MVVMTLQQFTIEWQDASGTWCVYGGCDDYQKAATDLAFVAVAYNRPARIVDRRGVIRAEVTAR